MVRRLLPTLALVALVAAFATAATVAHAKKTNASAAAGFVEDAQNKDGGFGKKKGQDSDPNASLWASVALLAARQESARRVPEERQERRAVPRRPQVELRLARGARPPHDRSGRRQARPDALRQARREAARQADPGTPFAPTRAGPPSGSLAFSPKAAPPPGRRRARPPRPSSGRERRTARGASTATPTAPRPRSCSRPSRRPAPPAPAARRSPPASTTCTGRRATTAP